jgi:hypothetical protein
MLNSNIGSEKMQYIEHLLVSMVRDLEETRYWCHGYAYCKTLRNILVGKENAVIAPHFNGKPYHGILSYLTLNEVGEMMDRLVRKHLLDVIYTNHGKLYCTPDYYCA